MKFNLRRLDLQVKILLILLLVIPSTFTIVTVAQNQWTRPILEEEFRQVGITTAKTLAAEIVSARWIQQPNSGPLIESQIQSLIYAQPNIIWIDVVAKDQISGKIRRIASNIEEDPGAPEMPPVLVDSVVSDNKTDESGERMWEISVPIEQKSRDLRGQKKLLGSVHLAISLKSIGRILATLWRMTVTGAALTMATLLLVLSYLLRKTIANDRLLREAESRNLQLNEKLHEAQRQLMTTEKLAVMGQLTASFAHEIGSPLNAIGGHLQLLKEDLGRPPVPALMNRLDIINGQVSKIEEIVKSFLQSTSKPASQRQLADINVLIERALEIIKPRFHSSQVEVYCDLDRRMGPVRIVPLELEQIMLNLLNNSLDSLESKMKKVSSFSTFSWELSVFTRRINQFGKEWAEISVYDTGEGIRKSDLDQVLKPFFTTKRPGQGTGLGLAICQELVHQYGGRIEIDSKEGAWTEVTFQIPYQR